MNQQAITKWIIVGVLVLVVTGLLIFKVTNKEDQNVKVEPNQQAEVIESNPIGVQPKSNVGNEVKPVKVVKSSTGLGPGILAAVNLHQITEKELEDRFQSLPDEYKSAKIIKKAYWIS